jgi:hypothetical protein
MKISYVDGPYRSFTQNVADALVGKEGLAVELVSADKVQLLAAALPIGINYGRLEGSQAVSIRLLGKGGTLRGIASAAIAVGAAVKLGAGGKFVTANSADKAHGIALSATAADGDFLEVQDVWFTVP